MFSLTRRNVQGWMRGGSGSTVMASGAWRVGVSREGKTKRLSGIGLSRCQLSVLETKKTTAAYPSFFPPPPLMRQFAHLRSRVGVGYCSGTSPIKDGRFRCCAVLLVGVQCCVGANGRCTVLCGCCWSVLSGWGRLL